ncbi:hypothetical protein Ga0074812_1732 [Parafrankia irregularis]|uniref:Uncharacterized protein n=1 Tax=Parafrankia irregularis TaxID=795642 RepID=A0A0S4R084_9ACTN|nr:hypothetical protein Ga0074812_1732 [Parafrankia irregularis]
MKIVAKVLYGFKGPFRAARAVPSRTPDGPPARRLCAALARRARRARRPVRPLGTSERPAPGQLPKDENARFGSVDGRPVGHEGQDHDDEPGPGHRLSAGRSKLDFCFRESGYSSRDDRLVRSELSAGRSSTRARRTATSRTGAGREAPRVSTAAAVPVVPGRTADRSGQQHREDSGKDRTGCPPAVPRRALTRRPGNGSGRRDDRFPRRSTRARRPDREGPREARRAGPGTVPRRPAGSRPGRQRGGPDSSPRRPDYRG